jgi:hypothetical protein
MQTNVGGIFLGCINFFEGFKFESWWQQPATARLTSLHFPISTCGSLAES